MSYNLRPEKTLKRPARYQSESSDELLGSRILSNHKTTSYKNGRMPSTQSFSTLAHDTILQSPLHSTPATPQTTLDAPKHSGVSPSHSNMPNVKYVSKRTQRPKMNGFHDNTDGDIMPDHRPSSRPTKHSTARQSTKKDRGSIYPSMKPAAFPSLPTPRSASEEIKGDKCHVGIREVMTAVEMNDKEGIIAVRNLIDGLYNQNIFPDHMCDEERRWYTDIKTHWDSSNDSTTVGSPP